MFDEDAGTDQRGKKKGSKYVIFSVPFDPSFQPQTDTLTDNQHAGRSQRPEPNCPARVQTEKTATSMLSSTPPFWAIGAKPFV